MTVVVCTDEQVLSEIDAAFYSVEKPEHFMDYTHCEECAEHDQLLRERDRETLRIEDVGNICWQPISFSSAQGIAYYMPTLARLALAEPVSYYEWYGDTLRIHLHCLEYFRAYCNDVQMQAIVHLLMHLDISRHDADYRMTDAEEMQTTISLWNSCNE